MGEREREIFNRINDLQKTLPETLPKSFVPLSPRGQHGNILGFNEATFLLSGEESISREQSVISLYGALCRTIQLQFRHFQIHFVKQRFGTPGKLVGSVGQTKLPSLL